MTQPKRTRAKRTRIPDDVRKAVADAYVSGELVTTIQERHHLERGTVYWLLRQQGLEPNRQARAESVDKHPAARQRPAGREIALEAELLELRLRVTQLEAEMSQRPKAEVAELFKRARELRADAVELQDRAEHYSG